MRRLLAVLAVATSLVVPPRPAAATSVYTVAFIGTMQLVGPGLGYMCTTDGPLPVNFDPTYLCAEALVNGVLVTTLPLPDGLPSVPGLHFNHNPHAAAFSSLACAGGGVNVLKPFPKTLVGAGVCSFAMSGTVTGGCDVNAGQMVGAIPVTSITGDAPQIFLADVHFVSYLPRSDGELLLTGHAYKSNGTHVGLIVGVGDFNPPNAVTTPGQSCYNLTALTFLLSAHITIVTT